MPKSRVVVLGWGSLIWSPETLKVKDRWHEDGPLLPVEFARISRDGRLTLVLRPDARAVNVLWARMSMGNLEEAIGNLAHREGTAEGNVGFVDIIEERSRSNIIPDLPRELREWLIGKGVDAAIWTDLPANFVERAKTELTADSIIGYLESLGGTERIRAEEYVRCTPVQIQTPIRREIGNRLGWTPLPHSLYETSKSCPGRNESGD